MKFGFNLEKKNATLEVDAERLIEKGMEQNDKNWKDKFNTKHNAKKEILEIKHKQKMEKEDKEQSKKNWFQKLQEEKRKLKELELEEKRRKEEEHRKMIKIKIIISSIMGIVGLIIMIIGIIITSLSNDPNSPWHMLIVCAVLVWFSIIFVWIPEFAAQDNKKKK